jgi:hypothetical protein
MTPATSSKVLSWEELCALPYVVRLSDNIEWQRHLYSTLNSKCDPQCPLPMHPDCISQVMTNGYELWLDVRKHLDWRGTNITPSPFARVRKWHDGGTLYIVYPPPKVEADEGEDWEYHPDSDDGPQNYAEYVAYAKDSVLHEWNAAVAACTPHDPFSRPWPDNDVVVDYLVGKHGGVVFGPREYVKTSRVPLSGHSDALPPPLGRTVTRKEFTSWCMSPRTAEKIVMQHDGTTYRPVTVPAADRPEFPAFAAQMRSVENFADEVSDVLIQFIADSDRHSTPRVEALLPTSDHKSTSAVSLYPCNNTVEIFSQRLSTSRVQYTDFPAAVEAWKEAIICSFPIPGPEV